MVIPAVIEGGSAVAGAALNYFGAKEANRQNKKQVERQMKFQNYQQSRSMAFGSEQAEKQMAFQERMSNTAYQRAMQDMRQAGLNPILAYQHGGSSTPGGASAGVGQSSGASAEIKNEFSGAVHSALAVKNMQANLAQARASVKQTEAQAEQSRAMTRLLDAQLPEKSAESKIYQGNKGVVIKSIEKALENIIPLGKLAF